MFTTFNKLLQRDEPSIHLLKPAIESLGLKLGSFILKISVLQNLSQHLMMIVSTRIIPLSSWTWQNRLLSQGDISDHNFKKFHAAVHSNFRDSLTYIKTRFTIKDNTISNTVWIDVTQRSGVCWENVQYFVDKYSAVQSFKGLNKDRLHDEFIDYQLLSLNDFPTGVFEDDEDVYHCRMDTLWWHISHMEVPQTSIKRFKFLPKIAEIVLLIPHSNAELETFQHCQEKQNWCQILTQVRWDIVIHSCYKVEVSWISYPNATSSNQMRKWENQLSLPQARYLARKTTKTNPFKLRIKIFRFLAWHLKLV